MITAEQRATWRSPRLAVLLALALAAWEIAPLIRGAQEGEDAWLASLVLLLLYAASAILLARGLRTGALPALAAGGPALVLRAWNILAVAFDLEREFALEELRHIAANILAAASNGLLIQDALAKPLEPAPVRSRLSRIRELPGWRLLLAQLLLGSALLGIAVFGGPDSVRYGKISAALFGTALLVYVTAIVLAKGVDAVYRRLHERGASR